MMQIGRCIKRYSRRMLGEEPPSVEDLEVKKNGREMRDLLTRGGRGGKKYKEATPQWVYFPPKRETIMTSTERIEHNKNVFKNIVDNENEIEEEPAQETRQNDNATYQMVNLNHLEEAINEICTSKCDLNRDIEDFVQYCQSRNNQINMEEMLVMKNEWKLKRKQTSNNLKIKCDNIGLEACITVSCGCCNKEHKAKQSYTKYHGTSYNGSPCKNENASWYSTNVRLVLATLASGLGAADISTFMSFVGLPNIKSFSQRQFRRIEMLIGKHLRHVADKSMQQALDEEINLTQKHKQVPTINWKTNDTKVGLTLGYDMGWSKRSSGNRYDSLSGHAFLVGGHSRKIVGAKVTSKKCSVCS